MLRKDSVKNNADALIFHTALCDACGTKSLFIAEPNKIWLAIPPALKCLRNGGPCEKSLNLRFFTRQIDEAGVINLPYRRTE